MSSSTVEKLKLLAGFLVILVAGAAFASQGIEDRIKKVGEVCLEGEECATATAGSATTAVADAGGGVESNYNKSCATCHNAGVAGAPALGDIAAWEPRIAKGMDVLYNNGINGIPPAMPQRGLCFSCSDDDIRAIVDYMVAESR